MSNSAVSTDDAFSHAEWRTFTPADGLPGLHISQIAQDGDGFVWFVSAHGGVSRFDGERFEAISHEQDRSGGRITRMLRDRQDRLWFAGTQGAMGLYAEGSFQACEALDRIQGFSQCLLEDRDGRIWFWGAGTLAWTDGENVCDLLPRYRDQFGDAWRYCWGVAQDDRGDIWLGGDRLVRYDGEDFHACGEEMGLPQQQMPYVVGATRDGEIWFGGEDQVMRFDGSRFQPTPSEVRGVTRSIYCDPANRLWFAATGGVYCLTEGRSFVVRPDDGLRRAFTDVFQDREGILWLATWGAGASCCDPVGIHCFGREEGLNVTEVLADGAGHLWLGSGSGLGRLAQGRLDIWPDMNQIAPPVLGLDQDGRLWRGGTHEVSRWDEETEAIAAEDRHPEFARVTAMATDSQGRLLFAHDNGESDAMCITRRDGSSFTELFRQPKSGHAGGCFACILPASNGELWLGLGGWDGLPGSVAGVARLDAENNVRWYRSADGLVDERVEDLCSDCDGNLWIATRGGISCFDGRQFTNYTAAQGLPVASIVSVCQDRQGTLWFGTENGVLCYDGERFQIVRSPYINGTVSRIVEDEAGQLWFATSRGVVRYVAASTGPIARLLRVVADRTYLPGEAIEVIAGSGQVMFEFKGLSTRTAVGDLMYSYRLSGLDDERWSTTRERQVVFADLPTGEFTFEVKAIDRDLNESPPARVGFGVVPDPRIRGLAEASGGGAVEFVGHSAALHELQSQLAEVATTDLTVLILGETGTGKGLAARTVHALSARREGPLVQVNCGALPESLVESELFGHEKGAFTSAVSRRLGRVELARGGTLFLDEIGDMSPGAQVKLLRLLEERTFERVGGSETFTADCRVIAATNRDLPQMVADGVFRQDLYYRLQVFPARIPPLRERRDDIPLLALYFAERMASHLRKPITAIHPAALRALKAYDWPGNVRELEHAVQRAVIVCRESRILLEDLSLEITRSRESGAGPILSLAEQEHHHINEVLERTGWRVSGPDGAATLLGLPESTLRSRMKKLGIHRHNGS